MKCSCNRIILLHTAGSDCGNPHVLAEKAASLLNSMADVSFFTLHIYFIRNILYVS